MNETLVVALLGNVVTLLVATGGWVAAFVMHREGKRFEQLQAKVAKLKEEVRARIVLEKAACEWLSECTERTPEAVKRDLRARVHETTGLRPKMAQSDLDN